MADIYDRSRKTAIRMLALRSKGGKGDKLKLKQSNSDDPVVVDGIVQDSVTFYNGSGVRVEYANKDIDGTTVKMGDVKFLVSPVQVDGSPMPTLIVAGDVIEFGPNTYTVINCKPWDFVNFTIGFEIQARK